MDGVIINGQEYKIGLRGNVFVYRCGTWMLALHVTAEQVILAKESNNQRKNKRYKESREKLSLV